ncbi:acyl-CoA carboxylase subunit beta [Noviherbaspirillum sedimenti]|uniref:Methylcrotonoyl-CoA carboxylase n=1 Tax=Noviherbaspirillum sedimenti TaxID=2320865 RepID=A0A3A3GK36_9BURK|nr:carboxyl transferase domain-containing protein [Noviherbaspirillum sedimenti]RJG02666.1 methylcrotonoyl-CoA carboxylase [Noviherbaspirillum sedimenti]
MGIIQSSIATSAQSFKENDAHYRRLVSTLHEKRHVTFQGASQKIKERHLAAGKLLPRDRVHALIDPGAPFLELGVLAGGESSGAAQLGAGIITGIGRVQGRLCMIIANDSTIKGGTYFGMTAKKHVRAQKVARRYRLPTITLVDSGGAYFPEQAKVFPDEGQYGSVFHNIVRQSAEEIPQLAVVHGTCVAGGAYVPSLCEQVVIVRNQGYMFLGGPEITFAATGEKVDRESLGGAEMHTKVSGVTDHIADNDRHALAIMREIIAGLPRQGGYIRPPIKALPPRYDPKEIYGIVSNNPRFPTNTREILARLLDDSRFSEFKPDHGDTLLCGFAHIHGFEVGVLANLGVLFTESALKAAHFIDLCCKRQVPLLFLADIAGFMVGRDAERSGIAKAGAKMITAMSSANVPKFNLIIGGSYGAGHLAMCSRQFEPDLVFGWPNGRAGLMGPDQAATTLAMVQRQKRERDGEVWSDEEEEAFKVPIKEQFESFADIYNFAGNLWIDDVIDPVETRTVLGLALDLAARRPLEATKFGVFRM